MKKLLTLVLALALMMSAFAFAEANVSVTGKVTEIEKYGHALLDVTIEDFTSLGFTLGDVVTVKAGTYEGENSFFWYSQPDRFPADILDIVVNEIAGR